jgi:hypothetical protein
MNQQPMIFASKETARADFVDKASDFFKEQSEEFKSNTSIGSGTSYSKIDENGHTWHINKYVFPANTNYSTILVEYRISRDNYDKVRATALPSIKYCSRQSCYLYHMPYQTNDPRVVDIDFYEDGLDYSLRLTDIETPNMRI